MTITLNLRPEVEAEIMQKASAEGKPLPEYIKSLLEETVEPVASLSSSQTQIEKNQAALAVLRQWREQDKTDDPEEIARRQANLDEFKVAINESHTSNRIIYP